MIPASAIIPIMDVAVKNAPVIACPGRMPMSVSGMGAMITRYCKGLEPSDHEHVDQHQNYGECEPQIAEHLNGYLPLAVPLDRCLAETLRLFGIVARDLCPVHVYRVEFPVHRQDRINRRFYQPGDVAGHIDRRPQVFADAGAFDRSCYNGHKPREGLRA